MIKNIEKKIYGYDDLLNFFIKLDKTNRVPNKFIISGKYGIGKSTFAHHLINYLFSKNEKYKYDNVNFEINEENRSFNLVKKLSHPNFFFINLDEGKEQISVDKVRKSFDFINNSSMNNDYRIILIDNIEFLNLNSSNALLKILEEPNEKLIFILIHNSSYKLLETIESRCLVFKKNFTQNESISIFEKLTGYRFYEIFDDNLLAKFMTVEELIFLKKFSDEIKFTGRINNKSFLSHFLNFKTNKYDKKNHYILFKLIQIYLYEKNLYSFSENNYLWYNYFFKKVSDAKKFNLDIGNLFFEFQTKFK